MLLAVHICPKDVGTGVGVGFVVGVFMRMAKECYKKYGAFSEETGYGVATISRLLEIIGLLCRRAL